MLTGIKLFLWFCGRKHVRIYNVIRFLNFTGKISCVSDPQMDLNHFQNYSNQFFFLFGRRNKSTLYSFCLILDYKLIFSHKVTPLGLYNSNINTTWD